MNIQNTNNEASIEYRVKIPRVFGGVQIGIGVLCGILSLAVVITDSVNLSKNYDDNGDGYSHRCDRHFYAAPLLSLDVMCLFFSGWRTLVYITAGPQTDVLGMLNTHIIQTVPGQNVSAAHTGVYPAGTLTQQYPVSSPQFEAAAPGQEVNFQSPPPYKI